MGSISAVITTGFFGGPLVTLGFGSAEVAVATVPGIEYTASGRLHWTVDTGLTHYTAQGRLHYTVDEEDA